MIESKEQIKKFELKYNNKNPTTILAHYSQFF